MKVVEIKMTAGLLAPWMCYAKHACETDSHKSWFENCETWVLMFVEPLEPNHQDPPHFHLPKVLGRCVKKGGSDEINQ